MLFIMRKIGRRVREDAEFFEISEVVLRMIDLIKEKLLKLYIILI